MKLLKWPTKLACRLVAICLLTGCYDVSGGATFTFPPRDGECVDPAGVPCTGTRSEADRTIRLPETMPDTTYVYVVSSLSIPEATPDPDGPDGPERAQAAGFDLDGLDSRDGSIETDASCEDFHQDFRSVTDPNHFGVDNALQGIVGMEERVLDPAQCPGLTTEGCIDASIEQRISEGSLLLLVEVSGVNDLTYDSRVLLQLHFGATVDGMPPATDPDGTLSPGQAFVSTMRLDPAVEGDIFEGRLAARPESLPLAFEAGGFPFALTITQTQIRFDISDAGLTMGAIGGAWAWPAFDGDLSIGDLSPGADPSLCELLSVGLLFEATTATLN